MSYGAAEDERFEDGLHEAQRGLWRSAAESFGAAAAAYPDDPAPVLAQAVCLLARGDADGACVVLETAPALRALSVGDYWGARARWLVIAAREAAGDPAGAERATHGLPRRLRLRALAHLWLRDGQHQAGVEALLISLGRTPDRPA